MKKNSDSKHLVTDMKKNSDSKHLITDMKKNYDMSDPDAQEALELLEELERDINKKK